MTGLGHMGRAAAARLLDAGCEVAVWNRTPGKADALVQRGARASSSPADVVRDADVVLILLTDDHAVRDVCLRESGICRNLPADAVLVDMSTVHPDTSRELGRQVTGGRFVDAPILGGPEAFQERRARLLIGGDEEVVHRLDTLWNDLSAGYIYTTEIEKVLSSANETGYRELDLGGIVAYLRDLSTKNRK